LREGRERRRESRRIHLPYLFLNKAQLK